MLPVQIQTGGPVPRHRVLAETPASRAVRERESDPGTGEWDGPEGAAEKREAGVIG